MRPRVRLVTYKKKTFGGKPKVLIVAGVRTAYFSSL